MADHEIRFDSKQIEELITIIRKESKSFDWAMILTILQSTAIIVGGFWGLYQYQTYQRNYEQIQLTKAEAELESARNAAERQLDIAADFKSELTSTIVKDLGEEAIIKDPAPRGGVFGEVSHYPPLAIKTPGSLREQATPQAAGNATRRDSTCHTLLR
jgi:hypothetical protein